MTSKGFEKVQWQTTTVSGIPVHDDAIRNRNLDDFPRRRPDLMTSNRLNWKTAMTISPTVKPNAEDISVGRVVIRRQRDD